MPDSDNTPRPNVLTARARLRAERVAPLREAYLAGQLDVTITADDLGMDRLIDDLACNVPLRVKGDRGISADRGSR